MKPSNYSSVKGQRGAVLIFALVVLVLMTLVATSMTMSSVFSSNVTLTNTQRSETSIRVLSAQEKIIAQQASNLGASLFVTTTNTTNISDEELDVNSTVTFIIETDCMRSSNASGAGMYRCRQIHLQSAGEFGRSDVGHLAVISAIEQPVLSMEGN